MDLKDYWSDWEYYSDDYYDYDAETRRTGAGDPKNKTDQKPERKRKRLDDVASTKKRKLNSPDDPQVDVNMVDANMEKPLVIYQSQVRVQSPPALKIESLGTVALLKDWKKRFPTEDSDSVRELEDGNIQEPEITKAPEATETKPRREQLNHPLKKGSKGRNHNRALRHTTEKGEPKSLKTEDQPDGASLPKETSMKPLTLLSKLSEDTINVTALANSLKPSRKRKEHANEPEPKAKRKNVVVSKQNLQEPNTTSTASSRRTRSSNTGRK